MSEKTHTIDTDLGTFEVTLTGIDGDTFKGRLAALDTVRINRIEYEIPSAEFTFSETHNEWIDVGEKWHDGTARKSYEKIDEPYVWVRSGWGGMRRVGGGDPTDGARDKLAKVLGSAIAPIVMLPSAKDDALAAAREAAAEKWDRDARYEREKAARALALANKYSAEAKRIRDGGEIDPNKRIY